MKTAALEFWFDFASTYSYLAAMRAEELAARSGVELLWRPFLLGPLFTAQLGIKDSPFNVQPVRGRYMWRDLERLCARYGLGWKKPTTFPRNSLLAARICCAAGDAPFVPAFCRAVFAANFAADRDINSPDVLGELLAAQGRDPIALIARAATPDVKAALKERTDEAARRGVFGAPTFFTDGEMFFGHDRMDHALDWARGKR
jgi:2-hydroxychromene-2-carboxylate isomerase